MKTESAGLSREEFEKWARDDAPSLDLTHCENRGDCQRLTFHYFEYATQKAWDAWQSASCFKQAQLELAEAKLREFGVIWEKGNGYVFDGKS